MKKIYVFVLIIFLAISVYSFYAYNNEKDIEQDKEITVILAVNSNIVKTDSKVLKGYESVLQEEGVAYRIIDVYNLQHLQPAEILKNSPAVIFPDRVAENLPQEIAMWLHDYLEQGGYSLIVYDAGSLNKREKHLGNAVFSSLLPPLRSSQRHCRKICLGKATASDGPAGKIMGIRTGTPESHGGTGLPAAPRHASSQCCHYPDAAKPGNGSAEGLHEKRGFSYG